MKIIGLFIPGFWHVFNDRYLEGLIIFAAFVFGLNAFLLWPLAIGGAPVVRWLLLIVAVGAWLTSVRGMYAGTKKPSAGDAA